MTAPTPAVRPVTPPRGHLLALNENPFGPLPSVRAALGEALGRANRYPEFLPRRLTRLIGRHLGLPPAQVVVGAGVTGVVMHILQEFVGPGDGVVMAAPTFDGYPIMTDSIGGRCVAVPLTSAGHHDLPAMIRAIDDRTGLVVLCSPHNPTGTRIAPGELESFLARVRPELPVILDEAYIEFVDPSERDEIEPLIARRPNVIVLRTFSKAFGLAALRVGYAVGSPSLIMRIGRRQVPFGMNSLAEVGVDASYRAEDELMRRVGAVARERDSLVRQLRQLGFSVPHSSANCLYLPYGTMADPSAVNCAFDRAGIAVKDCRTGVRITVADHRATKAVVAALASTVH